jgi:hypothetical protein
MFEARRQGVPFFFPYLHCQSLLMNDPVDKLSDCDDVQKSVIYDFDILKHYAANETDAITQQTTSSSPSALDCPLTVLVGRRGTDLPSKLISLLSECRDMFGQAYLFSPTAAAYGTIFPDAFCYDQPTEELLRRIVTHQTRMREHKSSFITPKDLVCLIVLDGCHMREMFLAELILACRRNRIALWVTLYDVPRRPNILFDACDILLSNYTSSIRSQQTLFARYFSSFGTFECFVKAFEEYTQDSCSIVWCKTVEHDTTSRSVFRYRCSNSDAKSFSLDLPLQCELQALYGINNNSNSSCKESTPMIVSDDENATKVNAEQADWIWVEDVDDKSV